MHRSKLAGFIIDCQTDDLDGAARFWSAALGMPTQEAGGPYVKLEDAKSRLHIEVQQVKHPSRVHLDIETDDQPAEVARLEALGAKVVEVFPRWTVMEAPTGQRFCVVRVQDAETFEARANSWPK